MRQQVVGDESFEGLHVFTIELEGLFQVLHRKRLVLLRLIRLPQHQALQTQIVALFFGVGEALVDIGIGGLLEDIGLENRDGLFEAARKELCGSHCPLTNACPRRMRNFSL